VTIHARRTGSNRSWLWIALMILFVASALATNLYGLQP
jgi:hypothetical protein